MADNERYRQIRAALHAAGISECEYEWPGLLAGLLSRGFVPGSREISKLAADLLNCGETLPGSVVAFLASEGLELKERLDHAADDLFCFPDAKESSAQRLQALSDLAHGLTLGLTADPQKGLADRLPPGPLLDFVQSLSDITRVDTEADIDEEDIKSVLDYMRQQVLDEYKRSKA